MPGNMLKIKFNEWLKWLKEDLIFNIIMIALSTMMLTMCLSLWIFAMKMIFEMIAS